MANKIELVEKPFLKQDVPRFNVGDTVKVYVKIKEEEKTRLQAFEGIVMRVRGKGAARTFTVRRISYGEGVERTFPVNSPSIDKIELVKKGRVKRAKIYYLRDKVGKQTRVEQELKEENASATTVEGPVSQK
jgi:large subunit ribosomal protein L19